MYSLEQKLKILKHVEKFGIKSALHAFEVKKSSIYSWQKKLTQNWNEYSSLQNKSTKPNKVRTRVGCWDYIIERFIQEIRFKHPSLTKEKVWKLLCDYAKEQELEGRPIAKTPSIATVGRIISDLKANRQIPDWSRKISFYAKTERFKIKNSKKKKKNRPVKKEWKSPGQRIQIDTVIILKNGIRRYIINSIDVYSRLSFSYAYKSLSSNSAKDFMIKMREVFPFINQETEIQNDNGSEFMKNFEQYLKQESITQVWNYHHKCSLDLFQTTLGCTTKHPKMNTWIERFNGSIQIEFIYRNLDTLFDTNDKNLTDFNKKLMHHLVWYNTKRPHLSLDLKSPMEFVLSNSQFSKMWWTRTIV
jgi:transposase InsO family protein